MFYYITELTDQNSFRNNMKLRKVEAMFIFLKCSLDYVFIVHFFRLKSMYISVIFAQFLSCSVLDVCVLLCFFYNLF